jgi:dynein heavy chain
MCSETRNDFIKERPGVEETLLNMYSFFLDRLRDNLHIVLCFSPVGQKFSVRSQKFPALFSCVTIDWFLPWPEEALIEVASAFLSQYRVDTNAENKSKLYRLMGTMQDQVEDDADGDARPGR